jgi:hypothetical protein
MDKYFSSSSLYGVSIRILFPLFTLGVDDTVGKFATIINNTSGTGGKFTAGVIDTGGAP